MGDAATSRSQITHARHSRTSPTSALLTWPAALVTPRHPPPTRASQTRLLQGLTAIRYVHSVLHMKPPPPLAQWGSRVAALRTERDWSQAELARQAGILQGTISRLESGAVVPNDLTRLRVARALSVSVYDLFAYDEEAVA